METEKSKCTSVPKVNKNSFYSHSSFNLLWQWQLVFNYISTRQVCCDALQGNLRLHISVFSWKDSNKKSVLLARASRRKLEKTDSLINKEPTSAEQTLIHDLFIRTVDTTDPLLGRRILPPGCVWVEDTTMTSSIFSHPEV